MGDQNIKKISRGNLSVEQNVPVEIGSKMILMNSKGTQINFGYGTLKKSVFE